MANVSTRNAVSATDERRQIVFASLLRYAPETAPLRERALDRLVQVALLNATEQVPFKVGQIQAALLFGPTAPCIRAEIIHESIGRLIANDRVRHIEYKKKKAYHLTDDARAEVAKLLGSAEDLFNPVLDLLLENTSHLLSRAAGEDVCRKFICECFASFGTQIAKSVTGHCDTDELLRTADVRAAFAAAVKGKALSPEAVESLEARCVEFLRGIDPSEIKLKFCLTQGFYFAHLLGLPENGFSPVGEQAFSGAKFYLDTNVILVGIFAQDIGNQLFEELAGVARKLGIRLVVTRATINEARRVAADRSRELEKVIDAVPIELVERSGDSFVSAFLDARRINPKLTVPEFLEPFDHLTDVLSKNWQIEVFDATEDEIISESDVQEAANVFQEEAIASRGRKKSGGTLRHDVAHYLLVQEDRVENPKTWFLTRDRSVPAAAARLKGDGQPFAFSLLGFLQSLSPFVLSAPEERNLADVFSALLRDQFLPNEKLFDLRELALLVDMHEDILSTPKEVLIPAVDFIKATVLGGKSYNTEEVGVVALGLRKFLASSKDEQRAEIEAQKAVLAADLIREREASIAERQRRIELQSGLQAKQLENAELRETQAEQDTEIESLQSVVEVQSAVISDLSAWRGRQERSAARLRILTAFLGWVVAYTLLRLIDKIQSVAVTWPLFSHAPFLAAPVVIRVLAAVVCLSPMCHLFRRVAWHDNARVAGMALSMIGAFWLTRSNSSTPLVSLAGIAGLIAAILILTRKPELLRASSSTLKTPRSIKSPRSLFVKTSIDGMALAARSGDREL
jgi:hypothetical protein